MARIMDNLLPPTGEFRYSCCGGEESPCGHGAQTARKPAVEGSIEHGYITDEDAENEIHGMGAFYDAQSEQDYWHDRRMERLLRENRAAGL